MAGLLNEAEGKNIKLSKDASALNSQLQDAQVRPENGSDELKPTTRAWLRPPRLSPAGATVGGDSPEAESVRAPASDGGGQEQPD